MSELTLRAQCSAESCEGSSAFFGITPERVTQYQPISICMHSHVSLHHMHTNNALNGVKLARHALLHSGKLTPSWSLSNSQKLSSAQAPTMPEEQGESYNLPPKISVLGSRGKLDFNRWRFTLGPVLSFALHPPVSSIFFILQLFCTACTFAPLCSSIVKQ
jgi:hypothetical protein